MQGDTYRVAAEHEATAVGHVVHVYHGKSTSYRYVFSVNGINVDDTSPICATALVRGACDNHGPVLVYYSYQPHTISLLQDFTEASNEDFRDGKFVLAISLPVLVLSSIALAIMSRRSKHEDEPDSSDEAETNESGDGPDVIHITPRN